MSEKKSATHSWLPTSQAHHMDCCDICGDIGVAETLITCSQCKINCEHMYCMRIPTEELLHDWHCEECESNSKQKPLASCPTGELPHMSKLTDSVEIRNSGEPCFKSRKLMNVSGSWEKKVATGKTKYISAKEAIMLSSGEKKMLASANNVTRHSKSPRPGIGVKVSERTPIKPVTVPRGSSPEGLASGHLALLRPQRLDNMEISERRRQKFRTLAEVQKSSRSVQPSQAPMNKHMPEVQKPREVQSPRTKAILNKKTSAAASPNASPVTISGCTGHTTIKPRISNAENVNNNLLPDLGGCSCSPALDALWKGNFIIHDDNRHGELNHRIHAHPPSKVRRKIYDFSKKMPEVLDFQLVPLKQLWINLFKEFIPDERDVGLYFFPSVGERSEDYISLLDSIGVKNLALRKQMADVELLVFTSKLLPVNRQCWEGKNFLWGVFHRLKRDTKEGLVLSVQPSDETVDTIRDEDMDIDMVGGLCVGREDVPVHRREPLTEKCPTFKQDSGKQIKSFNVKMERDDLIPPGFEEAYRLRAQQGSPSLLEKVGVQGKRKEAGEHNRLRCFPRPFHANKVKSGDL